jgi:hypothetical protein
MVCWIFQPGMLLLEQYQEKIWMKYIYVGQYRDTLFLCGRIEGQESWAKQKNSWILK